MANKKVSVTWLRDFTFVAEMGPHHLLIDNAREGREPRGPGPMDLLLTALAGCTAIDVISILEKQRQPVTDLVIHVEGERAADHPRRYTRVTVTYEVHGTGLNLAAVERAVALSEDKYCSVSATLREPTEVVSRIVLVDETAEDAEPE
jgi:putative redox protein